MKKIILFELMLLFLATTFESDSPPGWFQQTLPVSDQINDIFFLDSSTGWVCTAGASSGSDTGYVMKTTNGGENWTVQFNQIINLNIIQFLNNNTGYTAGGNGFGRLFKTTNAGENWTLHSSFGFITVKDLFFVHPDTGWICDDNPANGGVFKTTNGGTNWQSQLGASFFIQKLFFINKDTGWAGSSQSNGRLYRTTNGGQNWDLQYTSTGPVESIFFLNGVKGWIRGGTGNGVAYTTNGGINWLSAQGDVAGYDLRFVNDSIGYSGMIDFKIMKSTNGGKNWGYQTSPIPSNLSTWMFRNDTIHGFAGSIGLIKTTDGGGAITFTGITQISNEVPKQYSLSQNYPNPFNPTTNIKYDVKRETSNVKLIVYDIQGKEITVLVNQKQTAGTYKVDFDASAYSSGVYFYKLIVTGKETYSQTRKMILIK